MKRAFAYLLLALSVLGVPIASAPQRAFGASHGQESPNGTPQQVFFYKGVTADFANKSIYIVDGATDTVTGPFLTGISQGFNDVILTPDQSMAVVSSLVDQTIYFVDIKDITKPTLTGTLVFTNVPSTVDAFHPEDLDITPDGKHLVSSDGAFGNCGYSAATGVASVAVANRTLTHYLTLARPKQAQSVALDQFGDIFVGDYCNSKVYVLHLNPDGSLVDTGLEFKLPYVLFNTYVSPDSRSLFAVGYGGVTEYSISGQGAITQTLQNTSIGRIQSMAFSADGSKVYLGDFSTSPDRIIVAAPDTLAVQTTISLTTDFTGGFFGVDVMTVSPDGKKLYMGNMVDPSFGKTTNMLAVVDLATNKLSSIALAPNSLPTATAFRGFYRWDFYLPTTQRLARAE